MSDIHFCEVCGSSYGIEKHHIVYRSENKNLEKCQLNYAWLCPEHHRGHNGVHGKNGAELNRKLKLKFQNKLEMFFIKEYLTAEEVNEILCISDKALERLLKPLKKYKDKYYREDVIRTCMGGKLIIEE